MAETNIPPAFQLKALLASYPQLDEENPSSWFSWSVNPDIKPKMQLAAICHADMRYAAHGHDYLVTAVPKSDQLSLRYLRMLIYGPFKAFSDLIDLVKTKEGYYLQCNNLKTWPSAVIFNFCIATRVPIEFSSKLEGWAELLKEGYPEVLAFLMSHSMGGEKFKTRRNFPVQGHDWFDASADWNRIIKGLPDLSGLNYHEYPLGVIPCNVIWGKSEDYLVIRYFDNIKTAEYFGFNYPPKREKPKIKLNLDAQWKQLHWDPEAIQPAIGQAQAHINQILQMNQINIPQPDAAAWAQVAQAIHDEAPIHAPPANPVAGAWAQPAFDLEDDFPDDAYPDFDEEPLDDD